MSEKNPNTISDVSVVKKESLLLDDDELPINDSKLKKSENSHELNLKNKPSLSTHSDTSTELNKSKKSKKR